MAVSGYSISRANPEEGVKKVLRDLVPAYAELEDSEIEIETLSGGITNILFRVSSKKLIEKNGEIPVVVRIYGNNTEAIIDRKKELKIHTELSKNNLGSKMYGSFKNGFVHGFIIGNFLELEELQQPQVVGIIAEELAKWHLLSFPGEVRPTLWDTIQNFASKAPSNFADPEKHKLLKAVDLDKLKIEVKELENTLAKLNSPTVFCHNDLLHKNIIKNKDVVSFIDFEYANYNPRGFDIGNHFNEYAGLGPDYSLYPSKEMQYTFIRSYLKSAKIEVTEENIHQLYKEANQYALASHLFWGFWALVQSVNSDIDFNFLEYGLSRFKQYWTVKDQFLSI